MDFAKMRDKSQEVAGLMKLLGHPGRLLIMCSLLEGDKSVGELEEICELGQSQTSQFLKRMELENLVESKKDGNYRLYSIKDMRVKKLMSKLKDIYC